MMRSYRRNILQGLRLMRFMLTVGIGDTIHIVFGINILMTKEISMVSLDSTYLHADPGLRLGPAENTFEKTVQDLRL